MKESFVCAISGYYVEGYSAEYVKREVNRGFTMTEYIYYRLPEMEAYDGTLQDFVRMLIKEYPEYAK